MVGNPARFTLSGSRRGDIRSLSGPGDAKDEYGFLAHEQWLTFSRRYATWWQAILVRFKKFESFFLDVTFDGEGTLLQIKETRTEWLRNTTHFVIRKDGRDVGTIRTDPALRQQLRLQEVLLVSYAGQEYQIRSSTVTRKIGVHQNGDCIATSSRHRTQRGAT